MTPRILALRQPRPVEALEPRLLLSNYMVTNVSDSGTGSLRADILMSNASPGANTITFAPGLSGTITLTTGQLEIAGDLTIVGPGAGSLTVSGNNQSRVFQIDAGAAVSISGLTITGGHAPNGASPGAAGANGGGIYSLGSLTLAADVITGNAAGAGAPGLAGGPGGPTPGGVPGTGGGPGGRGGGIYSAGLLTVADTTIAGNLAGNGGNSGYLVDTGPDGGSGGGLFATAPVSLRGCDIDGNSAGSGGRANSFSGGYPGGNGGDGGGVNASSDLQLSSCTVRDNRAGDGGAGANTGPLGSGGSGGGIRSLATLTLNSSTVSGNQTGIGGEVSTGATPGDGGGIDDLGTGSISNCTIDGNTGYFVSGGGVYGVPGSNLAIVDCVVTTNGSLPGSTTGPLVGAGIANFGTMTLLDSEISRDRALVEAGGGIFNAAGATLSAANCTIAANSSPRGGGIDNSGTLRLTNVTVSGNSSEEPGGGIATTAESLLNNTIVAANTGAGPFITDDVSGALDPAGAYNLIGDGTGMSGLTAANHNLIGRHQTPINPELAPLGIYGGPTQTMALLPGSPAIDAGSNSLAVGPDGKPLVTDQRGLARIFNGTVDIGAFEYGVPLPGDADLDGRVDFNDVVVVARHYGMKGATWSDGDFNGDGSVRFDDLVILARNYGRTVSLMPNVPLATTARADARAGLPRQRTHHRTAGAGWLSPVKPPRAPG